MPGRKFASFLKSPFVRRMLFLATTMLIMFAATFWMAHNIWEQGDAVRRRFQSVHQVSAQLGLQISDAVHKLDTRMLRIKLGTEPSDWSSFHFELEQLKKWVRAQGETLNTPAENALLRRIDREIDGFSAAAHVFSKDTSRIPVSDEIAIQVTELSHRSKAIVELGLALATTHQGTVDDFLLRSNQEVTQMQHSLLVALALILCTGSLTGLVVYRDSIAPLRRHLLESQRQLVRQEKLAALGELAGGIAHEVRNPLTAIRARLFTLRKALGTDDAAAEDVATINDEIDRLERIVSDFLRFARPPEPALAKVDPIKLLCKVRDLLAPEWNKADVRIELLDSAAPWVTADANLIEQALINLVQNAAQAIVEAGRGGKIILRAVATTHPTSGKRLGGVRLEVEDDGPGIPFETQDRLFDPFFTTRANGTGLGLSLTARVMEKHGGHADFRSEPGRGTVFALHLPAA